MSESEIRISAKFEDVEASAKVGQILRDAKEKIDGAEEELFVHDHLMQIGRANGIDFDSWWYPQSIRKSKTTLKLKFVGSPSESEEQDIVTWLRREGAVDIGGELVVDGGGDVEVYQL